jgi:putative tricarboxylic transport membrane protein
VGVEDGESFYTKTAYPFEEESMTEKSADNLSPLSFSEKHVGQISSMLWIAFGIFVILQSRQLNYTDDYGPSAGFFPLWLGIILTSLGIVFGIQASLSRKEKREVTIASKSAALRMLLITIGCLSFIFLIERVGFYLSASLLFLFLLYTVEKKSMKYSLIAAVISFFLLWAIFEAGLNLRLPMCILK